MSLASTDIFVFRHGETDWNRARRFQGHTDIPLNTEGIAQAEKLGALLESRGLQAILTSDLKRAHATAEIANRALHVPIVVSSQLRECRLGDPEGMLREKFLATYGDEMWQRWSSIKPDDDDFRFPNGESKSEHRTRMKLYLEDVLLTNSQFSCVGVSTHGGSLRRLVHLCEGSPTEPVAMPNCVLYQLKFMHKSKQWLFAGKIE